jgi:hypothetical protein
MPTVAHAVHRTSARLRLRIPARRYDEPYFSALTRRLAELPGVVEAIATPHTAGVLLRLEPGSRLDPVAAIEEEGILHIVEGARPLSPTLTGMSRATHRMDETLAGFTGGVADLRTLTFAMLVGLGLVQAARGQLMAPGLSLLWYAFELIRFTPSNPDA